MSDYFIPFCDIYKQNHVFDVFREVFDVNKEEDHIKIFLHLIKSNTKIISEFFHDTNLEHQRDLNILKKYVDCNIEDIINNIEFRNTYLRNIIKIHKLNNEYFKGPYFYRSTDHKFAYLLALVLYYSGEHYSVLRDNIMDFYQNGDCDNDLLKILYPNLPMFTIDEQNKINQKDFRRFNLDLLKLTVVFLKEMQEKKPEFNEDKILRSIKRIKQEELGKVLFLLDLYKEKHNSKELKEYHKVVYNNYEKYDLSEVVPAVAMIIMCIILVSVQILK